MPLFSKGRNIAYMVSRMREYAEELDLGFNSDGEPMNMESEFDGFSQTLHDYADTIQILMKHGTRGFYNAGCHCDWCREASKQYMQRRSGKSRIKFVLSLQEDAL